MARFRITYQVERVGFGDTKEQAIDVMENERDTITKVRDVDREVFAEEKE